jgi:predicted O-linked N-acetylglucosamine transferase (SPINDLY family)
VAASLLTALGLETLITTTLAGYHARAQSLATRPEELAALKSQLASARKTSDLFSGAAIARKLETAYEVMWKRHAAGLPPEHIDLS